MLKAIEVLIAHGVAPSRIIFLNLVASPEGLRVLEQKYPEVQVVVAAIDGGLDEKKYIIPGLGDFGCRYFGTDK